MTAGGREPGRVQSVCKALALLECLAGAGTPLTLGALSRRAGLPKAPAAERIDIDENGVITGLF